MSQENMFKKFMGLHFPEQCWVITHPFVAKKALAIAEMARTASVEMKQDSTLDGDDNGGQVDAFRHAFWMALLSQKIGRRKARKLGLAHEKGNYIDYKKKILEEKTLPDAVACEMDLRNNELGISIGHLNKRMDSETLKIVVKDAIISGRAWIIKKDVDGNFLDENDKLIPSEDYLGRWYNNKCLVPSNFKR